MNCLNEEQIQQYLDNEYGKAEKEAMRQHLEICRACQGALSQQSQRWQEVKHSLELLVTEQSSIPRFTIPEQKLPRKTSAISYVLPLAVAAGLLLLLLLRPFSDSEKLRPIKGQSLQFVVSEEFDANKPVTDYPLTITVVAPDGTVSQTTIN